MNKSNILIFVGLAALSMAVSFLMAKFGVVVGAGILALMVGFVVLAVIFNDFRTGYLILVVYSFFLFHIGRIAPFQFPWGIFVEALYLLLFLSILFKNKNKEVKDENVFRNPVGLAIVMYTTYAVIEMFNPNSTSLMSRAVALREMVVVLLSFFVVMNVFTSLKWVISFTKVWVFLALLAALYGMYQEYFGLPPWDLRSVMTENGVLLIWGQLRKFSFLSDVSAFGLFMAYSATFCLIMALSRIAAYKRVLLVFFGFLMIISMTYSGTRTAFAQLVLGFAFYTMMSMNDKRTLILATAAAVMFLGILFGPFHSGTISRIRSTFAPSEDASMQVRDVKRLNMQPYARENPFGAGINTVGWSGYRYEPTHEMAGPYDPDSGYLKMALERGWIGLLINLTFYAIILIYGLNIYYKLYDYNLKIMCSAYLAAYFAMTVSHFTQDAVDQKPIVVIMMASCAIFVKIKKFDIIPENQNLKTSL